MKKLLLIALIFAGCKREAEKQVESTNQHFKVELLFEVDGCKVYRFHDMGGSKYFTTCKGSISWETQEGKHNIQQHSIETK